MEELSFLVAQKRETDPRSPERLALSRQAREVFDRGRDLAAMQEQLAEEVANGNRDRTGVMDGRNPSVPDLLERWRAAERAATEAKRAVQRAEEASIAAQRAAEAARATSDASRAALDASQRAHEAAAATSEAAWLAANAAEDRVGESRDDSVAGEGEERAARDRYHEADRLLRADLAD